MKTINNYTKEKAKSKAFKIGFEAEKTRMNCAQSTFYAVSSVLGIKNQLILRCMSALEAGGAITSAGSCGAFSAGLVLISYYFGRTNEEWDKGEVNIESSVLGQKLYKKFISEFETVICREIHNRLYGRTFNLMDNENLGLNEKEFKIFEDMGAHKIVCPTVVGLASSWVVEILWDQLTKDENLSGIPDTSEAKSKFVVKNKVHTKKENKNLTNIS